MYFTGKEKLYLLLNRIDDIRIIAPAGQILIVDPMEDLNNNLREIELSQLFTKLEKDEKVLKVIKVPIRIKTIPDKLSGDPYGYADDGCWHIRLLPGFNNYFLKIQQEPEYQEFTGKKPTPETEIQRLYRKIREVDEQITIRREAFAKAQSSINDNPLYSEATRVGNLAKLEQQAQADIGNFIKQKETYLTELSFRKNDAQTLNTPQIQSKTTEEEKHNTNDTTQIVYKISFTAAREILLNGFQIAKPDFDSENESVFNFLYANPNKRHTIDEIEKVLGKKIIKSLHKIVENLGFVGEIKRVFFDVTKTTICFRNPIAKSDLEKIGISKIKLSR